MHVAKNRGENRAKGGKGQLFFFLTSSADLIVSFLDSIVIAVLEVLVAAFFLSFHVARSVKENEG